MDFTSFIPDYINIFKNQYDEDFRIMSKWDNNIYFNIFTSENQESFDLIKPGDLQKYPNQWKISLDQYLLELESIFKYSKTEDYRFEINENTFSVKKIIDKNDEICKLFCSFTVTWVPSDTKWQWIQSLRLYNHFKIEIDSKTKECNALTKENMELKTMLQQSKEENEMQNKILINKFINLVNSKKDRIQELTDLLADRLPKCKCTSPPKATYVEEIASPPKSPKPSTSKPAVIPSFDSEDLLEDELGDNLLPKRCKLDLGLNNQKEGLSLGKEINSEISSKPESNKNESFDINKYLDDIC